MGENKATAMPIVTKTKEIIAISFLPIHTVLRRFIKSISSEFLSIYNDLSKAMIETRLVVYPTISATDVFSVILSFLGTTIFEPGFNFG